MKYSNSMPSVDIHDRLKRIQDASQLFSHIPSPANRTLTSVGLSRDESLLWSKILVEAFVKGVCLCLPVGKDGVKIFTKRSACFSIKGLAGEPQLHHHLLSSFDLQRVVSRDLCTLLFRIDGVLLIIDKVPTNTGSERVRGGA